MHQVLPPSPGLDLFSVTICKSKHNAHPLRRNQHTRFHYEVCLWYQFHRCISDLTELSLQPRECLTLFSLAQRTPGPLWAASHRDPPCFGALHCYSGPPVTLTVCVSVVCIQGRLAVVSLPSVCVSSSAVCPLCLSSWFLARALDRKWEIYFIWLELHCSFLTTGVTSL